MEYVCYKDDSIIVNKAKKIIIVWQIALWTGTNSTVTEITALGCSGLVSIEINQILVG